MWTTGLENFSQKTGEVITNLTRSRQQEMRVADTGSCYPYNATYNKLLVTKILMK